MKFDAEIVDLPERFVACVRHVGPYPEIGEAIGKIMQWAGPKGLLQFPRTDVLAVYRDSPDEVDASELRSDACITVPQGTQADGDVKTMTIPGGRFAVAHIEINPTEYGAAWDKLVGEWMPDNGCTSDCGRLCYELYLNDPEQHPDKKHIVDLCEPIVPA